MRTLGVNQRIHDSPEPSAGAARKALSSVGLPRPAAFCPMLPQLLFSRVASCSLPPEAFLPLWGDPLGVIRTLGASQRLHDPPGPSAGAAGTALSSVGGSWPTAFFPCCLNVRFQAWHPVPFPWRPSGHFFVPSVGKKRTMGANLGLHETPGSRAGTKRHCLLWEDVACRFFPRAASTSPFKPVVLFSSPEAFLPLWGAPRGSDTHPWCKQGTPRPHQGQRRGCRTFLPL
nr:uncharacterized protein LOC129052413 [Pongo abelii]